MHLMERKIILFRLRSMEMGGVQKVLTEILKRLDKDKYDIHLLLNLLQGELLYEIPQEVKIHYLVKGKESFSKNKFMNFIQLIIRRLILLLYSNFPFLLKYKLGFIPDSEIAFMTSSLFELTNSPFKNSRKINWFHSDIRFFPKKMIGKIIKAMKKCDITIFVSKNTQKNLENYIGEPLSNGICIYNIFDQKLIKKKSEQEIHAGKFQTDKKTFISVGRLDYAKGYDILLDAHVELIKEGFKHTIIIVGGGFYFSMLKNKIAFENVAESFILVGQKENPYPYIRSADYYIQSSRYEAYPLAIGEALILNKPIISTDVGGIREMITHEETAYIIQPSKEELKEAIKIFLSDSSLIEKIKKNQKSIDFERQNRYSLQQLETLLN